jgi:2-dehydro-3-deoxyglucarate aldolase
MSSFPPPIPNLFRQKVLAREKLIGCWTTLSSHISTEILGYVGFDWLLLDGEHSPNDLQTFIHQQLALKDSRSAAVVRPETNSAVLIKRLLDIGFYNFLIPMVESAEQAQAAVAATRYPPAGIRGVSGMQRGNQWGSLPDYFKRVNDHICVITQIESQAGVDAVDAIASVDGVDAVFIGPSDLAASLGHLGNPLHPDVQAAIRHIVARVHACGKAASTLAATPDDADRYIGMGIEVVAIGNDASIFRNALLAMRNRYMTGA